MKEDINEINHIRKLMGIKEQQDSNNIIDSLPQTDKEYFILGVINDFMLDKRNELSFETEEMNHIVGNLSKELFLFLKKNGTKYNTNHFNMVLRIIKKSYTGNKDNIKDVIDNSKRLSKVNYISHM